MKQSKLTYNLVRADALKGGLDQGSARNIFIHTGIDVTPSMYNQFLFEGVIGLM